MSKTPIQWLSFKTLNEITQAIDSLRLSALFNDGDNDMTAGLDPYAEQHFLLAMTALDTAQRNMSLCEMTQARAIASRHK